MTNTPFRQARIAAGLTLEQLARKADLGRATVQRAEYGERVAETTTHRIAQTLRVALEERHAAVEAAIPALNTVAA